jgi:hypothetical protein
MWSGTLLTVMCSSGTLLGIGSGGGGESGVVGSAESKVVEKMHRSASCVSGSLRTSSTAPSPSPAPMESASVFHMTQDDLRNKILRGMSSAGVTLSSAGVRLISTHTHTHPSVAVAFSCPLSVSCRDHVFS